MSQAAKTFDELAAGSHLAHYVIMQKIAEGGMGVVFQAIEPALQRYVAIKVLRPEWASNPEQVQYFLQEAQAVAALRHPNIVPIYYVGQQDEIVFFSMAYIEGNTFDDWIEMNHLMTTEEALWFMQQAVAALQAASQASIVHLDIKPSNFLIDPPGTVMLTDFGLAESLNRALMEEEKKRDAFGTPAYVSPEQIEREPTDQRTDMYSLGASLFHLMTGHPPFDGATVEDIIAGHLEKPFPMEVAQQARVPLGWIYLIRKLMERKPQDRFQNYEELAETLAHVDRFRYQSGPLPEAPIAPVISVVAPRGGSDPARLHGLLRSNNDWSASQVADVNLNLSPNKVWDTYKNPQRPLMVDALQGTIAEIALDQEGDLADLSQAAEQIPGFREAAFQLAEFFGKMSGITPTDDAQALEVLGLRRARALALTFFGLNFEMKAPVSKTATFDWKPVWQHQIACGLVIDLFYDALGLKRTGLEYAAGAFHDIGKCILGELYPYAYFTALERSLQRPMSLAECEREIFGLDHAQIGGRWLSDRGLPAALAEAVQLHEAPAASLKPKALLVHAVVAANHLVKTLGVGFSGNSALPTAEWGTLESVQALWQARRKLEYSFEEFVADFTEQLVGFPSVPAK